MLFLFRNSSYFYSGIASYSVIPVHPNTLQDIMNDFPNRIFTVIDTCYRTKRVKGMIFMERSNNLK
jgi:hypothetical protein